MPIILRNGTYLKVFRLDQACNMNHRVNITKVKYRKFSRAVPALLPIPDQIDY